MPDELYILVIVKNVNSVFDVDEGLEAFKVVGVFLDKPMAELYAAMHADTANHGDRILVAGYHTATMTGLADVLVVVDPEVN